ncbi:MAG TPA: 16S rRNA (cytidine(1402)-2'-O)-methyltransferase [Gemmatimonadaceae bacterium]|nr:16S rRNA (cytidine(1402)-2'-O)-methyltransferase [Gemmatimonadaceae bacterium]
MSSAKEITTRATTDGGSGTLYLVSTPIGNLGDMTFRAVEVLSSAALVIAEDTRHSRRLLDHFRISTPVSSYHQHNEAKETPRLIARLRAGESIALISDAGTPLISDPGSRLVQAAIDAGLTVVPVPGASSVMTAVVASGLPVDRFSFYGFLPRKGAERSAAINAIVASHVTVVVFEAGNRVGATLNDLVGAGAGERNAVVARELTKQFEEFKRGTVGELARLYADADARGEVVLVIGGAEELEVSEDELNSAARELRASGKDSREVMQHLVAVLGASRNVAYRIAHSV